MAIPRFAQCTIVHRAVVIISPQNTFITTATITLLLYIYYATPRATFVVLTDEVADDVSIQADNKQR